MTCDKDGMKAVKEAVASFKEKLPEKESEGQKAAISCISRNEGFMDASKVQYVSRAGNFKKAGFAYTGALRILKVVLSYDYLWINVRVKGGAYGCGSGFMRNGNAYFSSYRDPNLEKTNEVYNHIPDYIRNFTADERDMTKYIIGTVSELDTPLNPYAKGMRSVSAYFCGITDADLQKERDEVITASEKDIQKLADLVEAVLSQKHLCVIGNEEKITEQKSMFEETRQLF